MLVLEVGYVFYVIIFSILLVGVVLIVFFGTTRETKSNKLIINDPIINEPIINVNKREVTNFTSQLKSINIGIRPSFYRDEEVLAWNNDFIKVQLIENKVVVKINKYPSWITYSFYENSRKDGRIYEADLINSANEFYNQAHIINISDLNIMDSDTFMPIKFYYYYILKNLPQIEKPIWFKKLDIYLSYYDALNDLYNETTNNIKYIYDNDEINKIESEYNIACVKLINEYENIINEYDNQFAINDNSNISKFIPLKDIRNNLDSLHFKGCYIIRNVENNKIYVGQSKDIATRITQHFDTDCKPLNHIFFEDYYNSKLTNKTDLFEIRFEVCDSKDDLDKREKELINQFNSFNYGYNGTRGNN